MGSLALTLLPKRVSAIIPGFVYIENCYGLLSKYATLSICRFFEQASQIPYSTLKDHMCPYVIEKYKQWTEEHDTELKMFCLGLPDITEFTKYQQRMYAMGVTWSEWMWSNICYPYGDVGCSLQNFYRQQACDFIATDSAR